MAILGTLLVSVIIANAKLMNLAGHSSQRVEACAVADELMEQWWADKDNLPRNGGGDVSGHDGWKWRTHVADTADDAPEECLKAEIVVVDVFAPDSPDDTPAVSLEFLLQKKPEGKSDATARNDIN